MIEAQHSDISISRQCELIALSRASFYYNSVKSNGYNPSENEENLRYMEIIDRRYIERPFYGSRRITKYLCSLGYPVNRKRIKRLMQTMGLQAIYPRPKTSKKARDHKIYPYLLKGVKINRINQVWSADITYIPIAYGFMYLVAVMDWYSRFVLSWKLSNTLDSYFCIEALEEALGYGFPDIFNTDQGAQFTSTVFTERLRSAEIKISMDGRGRAMDNVFVERLWRSVKYEDIYIKDYQIVRQLYDGLQEYFNFYNHERFHQSLDYRTPAMIYFGADSSLRITDNSMDLKSYSHIHKKKEKKQKKEKLQQLQYTLN